jgi:1-acyl-sn-glycerol-3-phosphate acyltransferase
MHNAFDPLAAIKAAFRLFGFATLLLLVVPIHYVDRRWLSRDLHRVPRRFYQLLTGLLGFTIRRYGTMTTARPTLYVANHSSYLDVLALGAIIPASFVAKADVARWPVIGPVAILQKTVFVERRAVRARDQNNALTTRLAAGDSIILFPEGTSSDGTRVLPFKSSLFNVAEAALPHGELLVQPISITCTAIDGLPVRRASRSLYAWYGDMTLADHVWRVMQQGSLTIDVMFHAPVKLSDVGDRKRLAEHCQRQVAAGVEALNSGRWQQQPRALPTMTPQKQLAADPAPLA